MWIFFGTFLIVATATAQAVDDEAMQDGIVFPDTCDLPAKPGPCRAYFPSFFFNKKTGKCEDFVYGGCGGNSNRFSSKAKCEAACKKSLCELPAETGLCRAYFPSFFFNSKTGKCEEFVYGGCGGNANRFGTKEECRKACPSRMDEEDFQDGIVFPDTCDLPAKPGPCRAYFPSFFFNKKTDKCEDFVYGGCGGNSNRFSSKAKCEAACKKSPCDLPAEPGLCRAYFPRIFFNSKTGKCEEFIYGGCGGNANSFGSKEECRKACPGRMNDPAADVACFVSPCDVGGSKVCSEKKLRCYPDYRVGCNYFCA